MKSHFLKVYCLGLAHSRWSQKSRFCCQRDIKISFFRVGAGIKSDNVGRETLDTGLREKSAKDEIAFSLFCP